MAQHPACYKVHSAAARRCELEAILRSIAVAYAAFAGAFQMKEKAQEVFIGLAGAMDDEELYTVAGEPPEF